MIPPPTFLYGRRIGAGPIVLRCLLVFAAVFAWPHSAAAQVFDHHRFSEVRAKLDAQYVDLLGKGFSREAMEVILPMGGQHALEFQLALVAGRTYAIVAACDDPCKRVDLIIKDTKGHIIFQTDKEANVAILAGEVAESGIYRGVLEAPGCPDDRCQAGVSVLRLDAPTERPQQAPPKK